MTFDEIERPSLPSEIKPEAEPGSAWRWLLRLPASRDDHRDETILPMVVLG